MSAAGRDYLARAAGPNPPRPRQSNVSITEQLVKDVISAGGSLRLLRRRYCDRQGVDYHSRARLAERYGKVPAGKRLDVTRVSPDELQIDLIPLAWALPRADEAWLHDRSSAPKRIPHRTATERVAAI